VRTKSGVQIGIGLPQAFPDGRVDTGLLREFVAGAEALGYDSLWVIEQLIGTLPVLEPVSLLTYVAALTSRVRLGSAVLVTNLRNPVELAKILATVDQLSHGRLIVGVGLGHTTRTLYPIFGVAQERRVGRFVEGIEVMKALWTQPVAKHQGELWRLDGAAMEPKPVQQPHPPLWFGARVPAALKRAVLHGDGWMGAGSSSSEEFKQQVGHLRQILGEMGRTPAAFTVSKRVYLAVDDDEERAEGRLREWFGRFYRDPDMARKVAVWGNEEKCAARLSELVREGAQHLLLNPVFDHLKQLELLATRVAPQL
jgi:probable F420-dependent oxidoreductase